MRIARASDRHLDLLVVVGSDKWLWVSRGRRGEEKKRFRDGGVEGGGFIPVPQREGNWQEFQEGLAVGFDSQWQPREDPR